MTDHCPQCGCEDVHRQHSHESFVLPEVWFWTCAECLFQWGHE